MLVPDMMPRTFTSRSAEQVQLGRRRQLLQLLALALGRVANVSFRRELGLLEVAQNFPGASQNRTRHAGETGHLNTVALVCAALDNLAEEDNLIVPLAHSHVEIPQPRQAHGQYSQLMVMRGEERLGADGVV